MNSARKMGSKHITFDKKLELLCFSKIFAPKKARVPPQSFEFLHDFPTDRRLCLLENHEGTRNSKGVPLEQFFSKNHQVRSRCGDLRISTPFFELSPFSKVSGHLETSLTSYEIFENLGGQLKSGGVRPTTHFNYPPQKK